MIWYGTHMVQVRNSIEGHNIKAQASWHGSGHSAATHCPAAIPQICYHWFANSSLFVRDYRLSHTSMRNRETDRQADRQTNAVWAVWWILWEEKKGWRQRKRRWKRSIHTQYVWIKRRKIEVEMVVGRKQGKRGWWEKGQSDSGRKQRNKKRNLSTLIS